MWKALVTTKMLFQPRSRATRADSKFSSALYLKRL